MTRRVWEDLISEQDRQVYASGIFGGTVGIGSRPAIVVVDALNKGIGDEPLPILEAMARYGRACCGAVGWTAIPHIRSVIDTARELGFPVVYTIPQPPRERPVESFERFDEKMPNFTDYHGKRDGFAVVDEIAPQPGDILIYKPTASSFYRTDMHAELGRAGVDTLVVTGTTTSGCVRATVIDGMAHGYKINVVEDGVYDRGEVTHAINLFDMQAKYADVLSAAQIEQRLSEAAGQPAARSVEHLL